MRYLAVAVDYDGTIASDGTVSDATIEALEALVESGRRLVLVTGRELDDLQRVFPRLDLFERVVAENGALLYRPASKEERALGEPPPEAFVAALVERDVHPLSVGRSIVATWTPNEDVVLECIRDLGLELHVIFNKGAVMVLPSGVNKATGLAAALEEMGMSSHNVVGIGDAENDHAFLAACEVFVAVANAVPSIKEEADLVVGGRNGDGVAETIRTLLEDDLASLDVPRHRILLGATADGAEVTLAPFGENVLIAGPSGSGKTTITTGILERLSAAGRQMCVIDPEGDYETFEGAVTLGTPGRAPTTEEVLRLLESPASNAVVNLIGVKLEDRPAFLEALLPKLFELRARTGRPNWIVVDGAHHMLAAARAPRAMSLPSEPKNLVFITVHPEWVRDDVLASVTLALSTAADTIHGLADALGMERPDAPARSDGHALMWRPGERSATLYRVEPPAGERRRHKRKYAEGDLKDMSFYFRGPDGRLNLRVQNLSLFLQIADGVDDDTWLYHLLEGHIEEWFASAIKDERLASAASEAAELARRATPDAAARSRAAIRDAVEERYTAPAAVSPV